MTFFVQTLTHWRVLGNFTKESIGIKKYLKVGILIYRLFLIQGPVTYFGLRIDAINIRKNG